MKNLALFALLLLVPAAPLWAAPPEISIDPVVVAPSTGYLIVKPKTDAASIVYVSPHLDPFPSEFLSDKTVFIVPVRGLNSGDYNCWAVAASKTGEQRLVAFVVRVGKSPPVPPVIPPIDPPIDPPPPTPTALYFAVVRPDGPASPTFTRIMSDPSWNALREAGHMVKDFTPSDIARLKLNIPIPTTLPAVVTLRNEPSGSKILRGAIALPTTSDGILKLPVLQP